MDVLKKIAKLTAVAADLHAKQAAVLREIEALAAGDDGIGVKMRRLSDAFIGQWATVHAPDWTPGEGKSPYVWLPKDAAACKRLLAILPEATIAARLAAYFATEDPWVVRNAHPFTGFEHMINQLAGLDLTPPDDDEAATRRRLRDLRTDAHSR